MLLYFSATLFVSATLLFLVQPMIGKMILPQLGGTPAVWNTCMVFFQGVLLVGYGYTHLLTTTQPTRRQVVIHGVLLLVPSIVLPFSLGDWEPPTEFNPAFHLLFKLTLMAGLPFMAVSTTAPLLQKWFIHTDDPAAKDPYFLYGASNLGSMVGLGLYPTVLEPWLPVTSAEIDKTLQTQVHLWTLGYAVFVALVVGCAVIVWKALARKMGFEYEPSEAAPAPAPEPELKTAITSSPKRRGARLESAPQAPAPSASIATPPRPITLWRRLRWIGLAAAPSSLMLGITTHFTTDIAPITYFWIVPLALYLFTFILVFARWPTVWTEVPHAVVMFLQPCLLLFLVLKMVANLSPPTWAEFVLHLSAFFSTTLMCHGELAKDRPDARHLTEFYFWMSLGGVLGGMFNALFAPIAFQHGLWEYEIAMAFACLLRSNLVDTPQTLIPFDSSAEKSTWLGLSLDWIIPAIMGLGAYGFIYYGEIIQHRLANENQGFVFDRNCFFVVIGGLAGIGLAVYYSMYADRRNVFDKAVFTKLLLGWSKEMIASWVVVIASSCVVIYWDPHYDIGRFLRRSYLLALLVVIVLGLSLRPVRFGLSIAALFIAFHVYDRLHDTLSYEARGFFGLLRVRDSEGTYIPLPKMGAESREYEWKVYRTLIHGVINHGRQIIEYKDHKLVEPSVAISTVGMMGFPVGNEPFSTMLSLGPDRLLMPIATKEMTLKKRREPITYFHERNGVAEIYHKLSWPKEQPPIAKVNLTGASDARMAASLFGQAFGVAPVFEHLANTQSEPPYAVVGLGTGILASYAKPYQTVDFYEIDPLVKNMSIVPGYVPPWHPDRPKMEEMKKNGTLKEPIFYFLQDAQERYANLSVKLGDGRLALKNLKKTYPGEKEAVPYHENYYHVISLDAFSSDAIPVHLLTLEAVDLYLSKLAPGGVLVFNTTNKYVRIEGVLSAIAQKRNLECLYCPDFTYDQDHPDRYSADWIALRRKDDEHGYKNGGPPLSVRLLSERKLIAWNGKSFTLPDPKTGEERNMQFRWREEAPLPGPVWTDAYSNLIRIMRWR